METEANARAPKGPAAAGKTATARAAALAMAAAALAALSACGGGGSDSPGFVFLPSAPPPAPAPPAADGPMVRQTTAGKVEGVDDSARTGTWFWKGIPFAKPPVGALRWRAPAAPEPWTGIRQARKFGNACLQIGRIFSPGANNTYDETIGTMLGKPSGSEDCLFVNIWRPATEEKNLPVLLFIHGGSNISGYTADPLYDGAALAKAANAVVITASYRLGILGFLNVPQLRPGGTEGDDSGNFALLDNMAALRFIRDNAASFGGDPGNVTLSGESAGATNLLSVMTSPMAKGLFHKAFGMSGGISLASNLPAGTLPSLSPASVSLAQGEAILEKLLVADGTVADATAAKAYIAGRTPAQIADYLRAQDGGKMLTTVVAAGLGAVGPFPDGTVIPTDPIGAIAADQYVKVPMLSGNTRDEGKLFASLLGTIGLPKSGWIVSDAQRFSMMFNFNPDAAPTLKVEDIIDPFYLPVDKPGTGTGYDAATALITKGLFEANRDNLLDTMKTRQSNIWHYRLDWAQQAAPWNDVYGAAHAFDLPFVFGNFGPSVLSNVIRGKANEKGRLALSNAVMASVGAFMRKGDPNTPELGATWAPWPSQLLLDATPTATKITAAP